MGLMELTEDSRKGSFRTSWNRPGEQPCLFSMTCTEWSGHMWMGPHSLHPRASVHQDRLWAQNRQLLDKTGWSSALFCPSEFKRGPTPWSHALPFLGPHRVQQGEEGHMGHKDNPHGILHIHLPSTFRPCFPWSAAPSPSRARCFLNTCPSSSCAHCAVSQICPEGSPSRAGGQEGCPHTRHRPWAAGCCPYSRVPVPGRP
jgi:hypothetical protein